MSSSRSTLIVTSGVLMPPILLFTAQFKRTSSFKIKYLTIYHLRTSLIRLQNYGYSQNFLTDHSKHYLQVIINDRGFKQLVKDRKFRNILVHYSLDGFPEDKQLKDVPLFGLIEHFNDGKSSGDVAHQVEEQLERVGRLLAEWLAWEAKSFQIRSW